MLSGMLFEGETNCVQQDSHWSTIIGNQMVDDRGLQSLIRKWDSILRDPETERIANI